MIKHKIKLFVMDVDGTLTDGKIYMGCDGEMFKAFDIKDGYGIHEILPSYGVKTVILTGRNSKIVENRAKELEIDFILQGIKDKKQKLLDLVNRLNLTLGQVAYIGDDIIDLSCMKICEVSACPNNAAKEVKEVSTYITSVNGGYGAVREFIEWLLANKYLNSGDNNGK